MYRRALALCVAGAAVAAAQPPFDPWDDLPAPLPVVVQASPLLNPAAVRRDNPVLVWNDQVLAAIRADRTPPPVAARNLAVVHVAVHDAVAAVTRTHRPVRAELAALPGASAEAAIAAAAHRALTAVYPRHAARFDAVREAELAAVADPAARARGQEVGLAAADAVLAWRAKDAAAVRGRFTPRRGLGGWESTPPAFAGPLLPGWADCPPFALPSAADFRPPGPPPLDGPAFAAAFRRVREIGAANSPTRTADQTEIARFWADGEGTVTPPGHWNRIAATVAGCKRLGVADTARLFALLNVALADAGVVCWDGKYHFDLWRPVTAVRSSEAARLGLPTDPAWTPLLTTPPFPAYPSGHSTFSGAAAAVLADGFGTDAVRFADDSEGVPGATREYRSFSEAAAEAGLSRIYGGIHWDFDNADGLACGKKVGDYVCRLLCRPVR